MQPRGASTPLRTVLLAAVAVVLAAAQAVVGVGVAGGGRAAAVGVSPAPVDSSVTAQIDAHGSAQVIAQTAEAGDRAVSGVLQTVSPRHWSDLHDAGSAPQVALTVDAAGLAQLRATPGVERIVANHRNFVASAQWGDSVNLPAVASAGYTGTGRTVAVVDTGVQRTHPYLAGKVVAEACWSHSSSSGEVSTCPGGANSFIGPDAAAPCPLTIDGCMHGTHVAGIVAGGPLPSGQRGVASGASIIAVKVFTEGTTAAACSPIAAPCVYAYDSDINAALQWLDDQKRAGVPGFADLAAVNLSLGGAEYQGSCDQAEVTTKQLVDTLAGDGVATVAAAGNNSLTGAMASPACISTVVSVAAFTDANGALGTTQAVYSNVESSTSLIAPGSLILSSIPPATYGYMSGTSMATPVVSGAFALVSEAYPGMSVPDELAVLRSTGPTINTAAGPIPAVDLAAAVDPSAAPTGVTATRTGQGSVDVTWAAPASGTSGVTGYTVTALPTGQTCGPTATTTSSCSFSGLVDGPTYRFVVTPDTSGAPRPTSAPSNPIVFGSTFHPISPVRLLDTRPSGAAARLGPLNPISLQVAGANGVPADATAVVLNVTVTEETSAGYTVVYPSGRAIPTSSNLNYTAGQTVPNLVTVALGADGKVGFYNPFGATHLLVDLVGWYGGTAGAGYEPVTTTRMLDTRYGIGGPVGALSGSTPRALVVGGSGPVPADATAVVMNVTVTDTTAGAGYLTVYPAGLTVPTVSNLNYARGDTRANLVTVKLGAGGAIDFLNPFSSADVIADVVGYYLPGSGSQFYPVTPDRALDTRSGIGAPTAPLGSAAPLSVPIAGRSGVPATGATGVVMNVTAVNGTAPFGWLNVFPGLPEPYTSSLDYTAGQIVPNLVVVGLGGDGHVMISNSGGSVDVLGDVVGWFG